MHLMPSFSPAHVQDARRRGVAERRQQHVDDASIGVLGVLQATAGPLTASGRIGNLSTIGALAYSFPHLDTAYRTLATVSVDRAGNVAPQDANSKALWASLRDDEPMVLPTSHDEGLPG